MAHARKNDVESTVQRTKQIGSEVETTEFSNGTVSVDFELYKKTGWQLLVAEESPNNTGNVDFPTQRSGGLYKSSFILAEASIVEYNLRFPPIPKEHYRKSSVNKKLRLIRRKSRSQTSDSRSPEAIVKVRGAAVDKMWLPHLMSLDCAIPIGDMLSFTENLMVFFEHQFPEAREWATPDAERLEAVVIGLQQHRRGDETFSTFRFPEARLQSTIHARDGETVGYDLFLAAHDASEYREKSLRKAIEHVTEKESIFADDECRIREIEGVLVPHIEGSGSPRGVDEVGEEITTLVQAYETVHGRSRSS